MSHVGCNFRHRLPTARVGLDSPNGPRDYLQFWYDHFVPQSCAYVPVRSVLYRVREFVFLSRHDFDAPQAPSVVTVSVVTVPKI
jgi:hypothetical protein